MNVYGLYRRRKRPSRVTVKAVLTTSGLSECLNSMFALLLKVSFMNFVQIVWGCFHAIAVYNVYGRFHTLKFYSRTEMRYKEVITCFLCSIFCTPFESLISAIWADKPGELYIFRHVTPEVCCSQEPMTL